MRPPPLTAHELALMHGVFRRHPEISSATLFGSRAKGTHSVRSDVDLVVSGAIEPLRAEAIAAELDELPLPYRFEVQSLTYISHQALRDHIERVGIAVYPNAELRWPSAADITPATPSRSTP
jgi:predicted nucleotidyltransferase